VNREAAYGIDFAQVEVAALSGEKDGIGLANNTDGCAGDPRASLRAGVQNISAQGALGHVGQVEISRGAIEHGHGNCGSLGAEGRLESDELRARSRIDEGKVARII